MDFQNYWNAATDTPSLPAAGAGNVGHYYIVQTAGTYSGTSYVVGDVIFSNGTTWKKYLYNNSEPTGTSFDYFRLMKERNKPTDESWRRNYSASRSEWPDAWAQENGTIFIIPPAREELIIRVTRSVDYSDLIVADVDTVDLPPDIERVMIAGALEFVYNLPGDGQDKNMAQKYRMEFHRGLSNLKAVSMFGYGGSPMYKAGDQADEDVFGYQERWAEYRYHPSLITGRPAYRDWETDRKSTRLNSSHSAKSRMPSSA